MNGHLPNDSAVDSSAFLAAYGMDTEDPLLDKSDMISYLMNGYYVNHVTRACTEASQCVKPPVKMAIAVTEVAIDKYSQGELI